jgi:hypothetical protein
MNMDRVKVKDLIKSGGIGQIWNVQLHTTPSGGAGLEGPVTQSGQECLVVSQEAVGSNPIRTANKKDYSYEYIGQSIKA